MNMRQIWGILLIALSWGPVYLLIKLSLVEMRPITVAFTRCAIGFLILAVWRFVQGHNVFHWLKRYFRPLLVLSLTANVFPYVLCAWGETLAHSATAGIFEGTVPIFTVFLTWTLTNRNIRKHEWIGLMLGFLGLFFVFLPGLFQASHEDQPLGKVLFAGMAFSFAIAFLYSEKRISPLKLPPLDIVALQFLLSSLILGPLMIGLEQPDFTSFSLSTWASITGVAVTSLVGWVMFYTLAKTTPAYLISLATYCEPIIAIYLGAVVLGEALHTTTYIGTFFVLLSMSVISGLWQRLCACRDNSV
jgi:drug/metabolite transporter (DMT)-like permease